MITCDRCHTVIQSHLRAWLGQDEELVCDMCYRASDHGNGLFRLITSTDPLRHEKPIITHETNIEDDKHIPSQRTGRWVNRGKWTEEQRAKASEKMKAVWEMKRRAHKGVAVVFIGTDAPRETDKDKDCKVERLSKHKSHA